MARRSIGLWGASRCCDLRHDWRSENAHSLSRCCGRILPPTWQGVAADGDTTNRIHRMKRTIRTLYSANDECPVFLRGFRRPGGADHCQPSGSMHLVAALLPCVLFVLSATVSAQRLTYDEAKARIRSPSRSLASCDCSGSKVGNRRLTPLLGEPTIRGLGSRTPIRQYHFQERQR